MNSILKKLFTGSAVEAAESILTAYNRKWHAIVNYLYFANIVGKDLFDAKPSSIEKSEFQDALLDDYKIVPKTTISSLYKKTLTEWDILLPDWIALQIFYWMAAKLKKTDAKNAWLENLNWTDFCPWFLSWLMDKVWSENMQIILYGTYPWILEKTKEVLTEKGYNILYTQDWYTNLDWETLESLLQENPKKYTILLVARTTTEYPIQEIWSWSNIEKIKKNKLLVFNQWGTFDFWAGVQKRAPKLRRKYKMEWLRRLITDPRRNYKKVIDTVKIVKYVFLYLLLKSK